LLTKNALIRTSKFPLERQQTCSILVLPLYCVFALYHDRNTIDWTRWRHKITSQRGPTLRSCIGPASARAGPAHKAMKKSGFNFFSNLLAFTANQTWQLVIKMLNTKHLLPKFTIWYNCSACSFAFKMVSEGGRGSLLDAYYQFKEIPYYPALLICGQTH